MNDRNFRISRIIVVLWASVVVALAQPRSGPVEAKILKASSAHASATATQKAHSAMLVGKWFGEIEIAGVGNQKWIIERYSNGTY